MRARVLSMVIGQLVVLASFCTSSSRADVGWTIQPAQSQVSFLGVLGTAVWNYADGALGKAVTDANNNTEWITQYVGVPQAANDNNPLFTTVDPNFGPYAGFTNSLVTEASGSFTTVGSNFLSSVNFGAQPAAQTSFSQFQPTTNFIQSGNYYPQSDTATSGGGPGDYGNATPAQAALTLVGAPGRNYNNTGNLSATPGGGPLDPGYGPNHTGTAGRAALTDTAGYANSNGAATTTSATGTFDSSIVHFTGVGAFAVNYQGDDGTSVVQAFSQSAFFALANQFTGNGLVDLSNSLSGAAATGFFTRGTGANAYQYIIHVPFQGEIPLGTGNGDKGETGMGPDIGTATFVDLKFTSTFVAAANLGQGDANFDGIVNGQDIAAVASHWLQTNAQHLGTGDATGDGIVNGQDLAMIASHWLQATPSGAGGGGGGGSGSAVPEPGTCALAGIGALMMALAAKRRHGWRR